MFGVALSLPLTHKYTQLIVPIWIDNQWESEQKRMCNGPQLASLNLLSQGPGAGLIRRRFPANEFSLLNSLSNQIKTNHTI